MDGGGWRAAVTSNAFCVKRQILKFPYPKGGVKELFLLPFLSYSGNDLESTAPSPLEV